MSFKAIGDIRVDDDYNGIHFHPLAPSNFESIDEAPDTSISSSISKGGFKKRASLRSQNTIEELRVSEVRWLYRDESGKKWVPFIGYDSCQLEWKYKKCVELNDLTDEEDKVLVRGSLYEVDILNRKCSAVYWTEDTVDVMRGTWFYQSYNEPLEESMACQIEKEHLNNFSAQSETTDNDKVTSTSGKKEINVLDIGGYHIDWYSPTDVYLYSNTTGSRIARSIGITIGFSKATTSGYKLIRGYPTLATLEDKPPPISHLVFVVHGVGQIMDKRNIIKACADLRKGAEKSIKKHFPELLTCGSTKRVEFLPVEWRSSLTLDGCTVQTVTPERLKSIRHVLNSTVMDILYYTSPLYRSEIIKGLQLELNRLYSMFCSRHPGFEPNEGKVSIVSHSLGCVIIYDILTGWNPIHLYDQYLSQERGTHPDVKNMEELKGLATELSEARKRVSELEDEILATNQVAAVINTSRLDFKVDNLFCLGSPLAVFLTLRGVRPQGKNSMEHLLPKKLCCRIFNIYFPSDPVAYRIEPLILRRYHTLHPLQIHLFGNPDQTPYHEMHPVPYSATPKTAEEMKRKLNDRSPYSSQECLLQKVPALEDVAEASNSKVTSPSGSVWSRWMKSAEDPNLTKYEVSEAVLMSVSDTDDVSGWTPRNVPDGEDSFELEDRIDFELRESSYSSLYYSALTSHMSYWTSLDVALFVVTHLFPDFLQTNTINNS